MNGSMPGERGSMAAETTSLSLDDVLRSRYHMDKSLQVAMLDMTRSFDSVQHIALTVID